MTIPMDGSIHTPTDNLGAGPPITGTPGQDVNANPAAIDAAKQKVGLHLTTDNLFFADLQPKPQIHQADPGKPTLTPANSILLQDIKDASNKTTDGIASSYQKILNSLDPTLLSKLLLDLQKSPGDRDLQFVALEDVLRQYAAILSNGKEVPDGKADKSAETAKTMQFSNEILKNSGSQLDTVLKFILAQMDALQGASDKSKFAVKSNQDQIAQAATKKGDVPVDGAEKKAGYDPLSATSHVNLFANIDTDSKEGQLKFLKQIGEAVVAARALLGEIEALDAKNLQTLAASRMQLAKDKLQATMDALAKAAEMAKKQEQNKLIMKILGPIISVVMAAIAIAITVGSAGALAPAAFAAVMAVTVALSAASVAISVADSVTGFMSEPMGRAMDKLKSDLADKVGKDTATWLFPVLMVTAVILMIIIAKGAGSSGASAASSAAASATEKAVEEGVNAQLRAAVNQVANEVVQQTAKEGVAVSMEMATKMAIQQASENAVKGMMMAVAGLEVQMISTTITSSKCLQDMMGQLYYCCKNGRRPVGDEAEKDSDCQMFGVIMQALLIALMSVGVAYSGTSGMNLQSLGGGQSAARGLAIFGGLAKGAQGTSSAVINFQLADLALEKGQMEAQAHALKALKEMNETSHNDAVEAFKGVSKAKEMLNQLFNSVIGNMQQIATRLFQV